MTWLLLRLGLLFATCVLMPVPRWIKLATLGVSVVSAQFLFDLNLGNVSLIVTFFAVVAWRWLDKPLSGLSIAASLTDQAGHGRDLGLVAGSSAVAARRVDGRRLRRDRSSSACRSWASTRGSST